MKKKLRDLFYPVSKQKNASSLHGYSQNSCFNESLFYQTAGELFNYSREKVSPNAKELIDALLAHGARSARFNQPYVRIAINVFGPNGHKAVKIKMAK